MGLVRRACVVERRPAFEPKWHSPVDGPDAAHQLIHGCLARIADRHVVTHFSDAIGVHESRDQDIGIRPIVLLLLDILPDGRNTKTASFLIVENCTKYARRIKTRYTQPIDRAI